MQHTAKMLSLVTILSSNLCMTSVILVFTILYCPFQFDTAFAYFRIIYQPAMTFSGSLMPAYVRFISDLSDQYHANIQDNSGGLQKLGSGSLSYVFGEVEQQDIFYSSGTDGKPVGRLSSSRSKFQRYKNVQIACRIMYNV